MKLENYKIVLVRLSNSTEKINCMLIWQFSQQNCNLTLNDDMLSIKVVAEFIWKIFQLLISMSLQKKIGKLTQQRLLYQLVSKFINLISKSMKFITLNLVHKLPINSTKFEFQDVNCYHLINHVKNVVCPPHIST